MVYKGRLVKVEFRMVLATIDKNLIFQLASFSRLSPINPFSVFSSSSHASMVHLDTPLNLKSTEPGILSIWRVSGIEHMEHMICHGSHTVPTIHRTRPLYTPLPELEKMMLPQTIINHLGKKCEINLDPSWTNILFLASGLN